MNYDAQKVTYQEVAIFDRPALFTECRIDRATIRKHTRAWNMSATTISKNMMPFI